MALRHTNVLHWIVNRLLEPSDLPHRQRGAQLILFGSVSLTLWLMMVLLVAWWLLSPCKTVMNKGPSSAELTTADRGVISELVFVIAVIVVPLVLAPFLFWGCGSSLAIAAGLFQFVLQIPFRDVNHWFDQLPWHGKIVTFPFLLSAMLVIVALPILLVPAIALLLGIGS
jgi:hypothetical protein